MTYEEIIEEVTWRLKNESSEIVAKVPEFVNDAIGIIAEDCDLPALKTAGISVTTLGQAWTTMPTISAGRLLYAGTTEGQLTICKDGLDGLYRDYTTLDNEGDLETVALEANVLWYQNIPAEETNITVLYFASPTLLVSPNDVPSCIPLILHRDTIVPKVCEIAFGIIESKMESKPNTDRSSGEYEQGKAKLLGWISKRTGPKEKTIWDV